MAYPLPQDPKTRANWLGRYLAVERKFDDKLKDVLTDALSGVDDAFGKLGNKFSDKVRRAQLSQSSRALRSVIGDIFGSTGNLIREHRQDAAVAAVDAGLYDQSSILARLFPNSRDRETYADSLRQTGRRNIESVMTRVLETELPLSKRVYKSQALATGQVSTIINRALARGDSAANIARDVKALIDPAVPGGVSYAAKRLGRTEINNAFHAQSIHDAQETPWVQSMRWHLSKVHVSDPGDECEDYALIGLFAINLVPHKPHPNCRCFVTPELPDYQTFENGLLTGQYDSYLDDVLGFEPIPTQSAYQVSKGLEPPTPERKPPIFPTAASKVPKAVKAQRLSEIEDVSHALAEAKRRYKTNITGIESASPEHRTQIFNFVQDYREKYPQVPLNHIDIKDLPRAGAQARTLMGDPDNITIEINRSWVADTKFAKNRATEDMSTGFYDPHTRDDPVYGTLVHEFGHTIHAHIGGKGEFYYLHPDRDRDPGFALHEAWQADDSDDSETLEEYTLKMLSGYSFEKYDPKTKTKFNFVDFEAIAESFLAVDLTPQHANSAQKALHSWLIGHLKRKVKK